MSQDSWQVLDIHPAASSRQLLPENNLSDTWEPWDLLLSSVKLFIHLPNCHLNAYKFLPCSTTHTNHWIARYIHFAFIEIPFIRAFSSLILRESGLCYSTHPNTWCSQIAGAHSVSPSSQPKYEYQSNSFSARRMATSWRNPLYWFGAVGELGCSGLGYESQMLIGSHIRRWHLVLSFRNK